MSFIRPRAARWAAVSVVGGLVVAGLSLVGAPTPAQAATVSGIDISGWQHPNGAAIDFAKVKAAGQSYVIVKATEGTTFVNSYFADDIVKARKAGLIVGAYHFARPSLPLTDAVDEAKHFVATVQRTTSFRATSTLPPVLDLETTGGLGRADLIAWAQKWLQTVEYLTGRKPMFYSYDSFVRNTLGNTTVFKTYPLWYARYTSVTPTASTLPGGWTYWSMWQYTSTGRVSGISGDVDLNRFNGSLANLQVFADGRYGSTAPPSPPTSLTATPAVGSVKVAWAAPTDSGGLAITRYRVSVDGGPETIAPQRSFIATGLTAGEHTFTVKAENSRGIGFPATVTATVSPYTTADLPAPVAPVLRVTVPATGSGYTAFPARVVATRPDTGQAIPGLAVSVTVTPEYQQPLPAVTGTSRSDGGATISVKAPIDAVVVARTGSTAWYGAGWARTGIRIKPTLSAFLTGSTVKRTGRVLAYGGTYAGISERVYLQVWTGSRWSTLASQLLVSGRYSFVINTATKGKRTYRVLLPESRRHLAVNSRGVTLSVL